MQVFSDCVLPGGMVPGGDDCAVGLIRDGVRWGQRRRVPWTTKGMRGSGGIARARQQPELGRRGPGKCRRESASHWEGIIGFLDPRLSRCGPLRVGGGLRRGARPQIRLGFRAGLCQSRTRRRRYLNHHVSRQYWINDTSRLSLAPPPLRSSPPPFTWPPPYPNLPPSYPLSVPNPNTTAPPSPNAPSSPTRKSPSPPPTAPCPKPNLNLSPLSLSPGSSSSSSTDLAFLMGIAFLCKYYSCT